MKKQAEKKKYTNVGTIAWGIKNIWQIDPGYCLLALPAIPLGIFSNLTGAYFPKVLVDLLGKGTSTFVQVAAIVIIYQAVMLVLNWLMKLLNTRKNMRQLTISSVYQGWINCKSMTCDCENCDRQEFRDLMEYVMRDAGVNGGNVEAVYTRVFSFAEHLLGIATYASLVAVLNPILFAVIAFTCMLSFFSTRWESKYYEKHVKEWEREDRKRKYLENLSGNFNAAKDIKLYGMAEWIDQLLCGYRRHVLLWQKRSSLRGLWASIFAACMTFVQDGAAYVVLIGALAAGRISVGDFIFYFSLVGSISGYLTGLIWDVSNLLACADALRKYRTYFDYPDAFNHGLGCALPVGNPVEIELRDVYYRYPGAQKDTLKGINLVIRSGERLALVGLNGAGKTTLVRLICGLYRPSSGQILINGQPIEAYNIEEYYTLISAVFQTDVYPAMTLLDFLSTVTDIPDRSRAEAALRMAGLGDKLNTLSDGMDTYMGKGVYPGAIDLSGGEKQKLLLARALYKDGVIFVLDEPTAALDPIAENELYLKYADLTCGKTSVYISHRLASTRFCDRIALIENGMITELGDHETLIQSGGNYAKLFHVQSKYYKEEPCNEEK